MKKIMPWIAFLILGFGCTGCHSMGEKSASISIIYCIATLISLMVLVSYHLFIQKKSLWYIVLFSTVLLVNIGYFWLSSSRSLDEALWANRLAYAGSVFLPMSMLMIILNTTNTTYKKWFPISLTVLCLAILFIAGSPGYLDIYYKEVYFEVTNGVSTLKKVYGAWHPLYLVYLLGYFGSMIAVIVHAVIKKTFDTPAHAAVLLIAVFVNLGVWFLEQIIHIDFEILSVSYIISEMFLFVLHPIFIQHKQLKERVDKIETSIHSVLSVESPVEISSVSEQESVPETKLLQFTNGIDALTLTERKIYDAYISRATTKEIMVMLNIKESTLKFHNRNIYGKLGVNSRKELLEIHKQIKAVQENGSSDSID